MLLLLLLSIVGTGWGWTSVTIGRLAGWVNCVGGGDGVVLNPVHGRGQVAGVVDDSGVVVCSGVAWQYLCLEDGVVNGAYPRLSRHRHHCRYDLAPEHGGGYDLRRHECTDHLLGDCHGCCHHLLLRYCGKHCGHLLLNLSTGNELCLCTSDHLL